MPEKSAAQRDMELAGGVLSSILSSIIKAIIKEKFNPRPDNEKISAMRQELLFYREELDAVINDDLNAMHRSICHYPQMRAKIDQL